MSKVVLSKLEKVYPASRNNPPFQAVKGIDLQIEPGEFMVLVGPSGCGKSTTLRMIAGLEDITSGTVHIADQMVNELPPKDRGIAMVFQNYALYPHMTVFDNMAFGLKLARTPKVEIHRRVTEGAKMLGLEDLLERKPAALSGGQRQRVAVGRALVRNPKVFLFDEPLSNLDAKMRLSMRSEISKLHDRLEATMVYVTHDQVEAMTMGDRICVMRGGEIMQVADPLTLYNQPDNTYVAGFIGSPPMNLIEGAIREADGKLQFEEHPSESGPQLSISLDDRLSRQARRAVTDKITLGIRPEWIMEEMGPTTTSVETIVELAEPMGAETHLHLRTANNRMIARVKFQRIYEENRARTVYLDLASAQLFDTETEQALRNWQSH